MRKIHWIVALFISLSGIAQQTPQYTHYLFNEFGINPAAGGGANCFEIQAGMRQQWIGFANAPNTQFASGRKTFGKGKYSTNGWHTAGGYVEQDKNEIIKAQSIGLSYAYQMKLTSRYLVSAGIRVAYRIESVNATIKNPSDPALASLPAITSHVPDISLGVRLYNKKTFYSLAVRQVYKNRLNGIGINSKLTPQYHFILGRRIDSGKYYYSYLPSASIKFSAVAPPAVDLNFMMYVKGMIGAGIGYRVNDAAALMIQVKYKGIGIALAYEIITSKMRAGASASREIMASANNCPGDLAGGDKKGCPAYDY